MPGVFRVRERKEKGRRKRRDSSLRWSQRYERGGGERSVQRMRDGKREGGRNLISVKHANTRIVLFAQLVSYNGGKKFISALVSVC